MDQIQEWLLSSIWGMLILGALGSIIGTFLYKVIKKSAAILFPKISRKFTELKINIHMWFIKKAIDEHLVLFFKESTSKLHAYYASMVARITIGFFLSTWLIYGSVITFENDIIWGSVSFISIALVVIVMSLRSYFCLSAAWNFDLEAKIEKSATDAVENAVKEALPRVLDGYIAKQQANKAVK